MRNGPAGRLVARIVEYVHAGVTEVCAIFYAPDLAATLHQMELFVAEVLPTLRAAASS